MGDSEVYVAANGISAAPVIVNLWRWKAGWPFDEAMVNRLIGSLADGDLWVLGPNGPVPVDPWGPKYIKAAEEAWKKLIEAVRQLQSIGHDLDYTRLIEAKGKPVAVDLVAEETKTEEHLA